MNSKTKFMKVGSRTKTHEGLAAMQILAWIAFIGYMIEAGAKLTSYAVSYVNPAAAKNLYLGLNLYDLRQLDFWQYSVAVLFLTLLPLMKSYIAWLVISTLSKFNMNNPFTAGVAGKLEKISFAAFVTWCVTIFNNAYITWLMKKTGGLQGNLLATEFIFMVGLVFIISKIFRRGVEIQTENELTI